MGAWAAGVRVDNTAHLVKMSDPLDAEVLTKNLKLKPLTVNAIHGLFLGKKPAQGLLSMSYNGVSGRGFAYHSIEMNIRVELPAEPC